MRHIFEDKGASKPKSTRSKNSCSNMVRKTRSGTKANSDSILTGKFLFELYDLFDFQHCINSIGSERDGYSEIGKVKPTEATVKSPIPQAVELATDSETNKPTEDEFSVPLDSPLCSGATEIAMDLLAVPRINGFVEQDNGGEVRSLDGTLNIRGINAFCEQEASFYKKSRLLWLHELIIGDIYDDW